MFYSCINCRFDCSTNVSEMSSFILSSLVTARVLQSKRVRVVIVCCNRRLLQTTHRKAGSYSHVIPGISKSTTQPIAVFFRVKNCRVHFSFNMLVNFLVKLKSERSGSCASRRAQNITVLAGLVNVNFTCLLQRN